MSTLEIEIREKIYPAAGGSPAHVALQDLRLSVAQGEFVCILGPSGCGKTTLLNCIAGLDRDYDGSVQQPSAQGQPHPVIGYVFQEPRLLPWRSVRDNIKLVLNEQQIRSGIVEDMLAATGLESFAQSYPQRLSLGMERRVALSRAFVIAPDLLLMDEPFVSLDEPTAQRLRMLLVGIWKDRPTTVVFVTHNLREVIQLADRMIVLSHAPGGVRVEIPISLSRVARDDSHAIEEFRHQLVSSHPKLFQGL